MSHASSVTTPGRLKWLGPALLGAVLGGVAVFPLAVLAFFNWRADAPGAVAWGLWALVLAGSAGGVLLARSRHLSERHRKWSRLALGVVGIPVVLGWLGLIALVIQELLKSSP